MTSPADVKPWSLLFAANKTYFRLLKNIPKIYSERVYFFVKEHQTGQKTTQCGYENVLTSNTDCNLSTAPIDVKPT